MAGGAAVAVDYVEAVGDNLALADRRVVVGAGIGVEAIASDRDARGIVEDQQVGDVERVARTDIAGAVQQVDLIAASWLLVELTAAETV